MRSYLVGKKLLLVFALLVAVIVPTAGYAAVVASDEGSATVEAGRTVDDDLYIAGDQVLIEGTVNGDVYAAGSSVEIKGTVNGSVFAAGQDVFISGTVTGGVRTAGQTVRITSPAIGGGVTVFAQNMTIEGDTVISGGLNFASSRAVIRGAVAKSVAGGASKVVVSGKLGKDVYVGTDDLTLEKTAVIGGDLNYHGSATIHRQSGAQVLGETSHNRPAQESNKNEVADTVFAAIWSLAAIYLVGALLLWLVPHLPLGVASELTERPLAALGWGVLGLVVTPILIILMLISFVGLPLALIAAGLYALAIYLTHFWVGLAIGEWISGKAEWRPNPYANAFVGLLVLTLVELLPFIGGFVVFMVVLIGFGGLIQYGKRHLPRSWHPPKVKVSSKPAA